MRALVLALLAACNPTGGGPRWQPSSGPPREGGTLHVAFESSVTSLDPTIAYDESSFYVIHALFDTLLDYAPGATELVPRLAERWSVDPDGKTLRFLLKPGLRYADGRPIVTADLKYSLERALTTPDSPFGPFLADVVGATELAAGNATDCAGITTPTDRDLVIALHAPNMALPYILAMPFATPQRRDHVAKAGDQLRREPLATGPYALERWDEGGEIVLVEASTYGDPSRNRIPRIEIRENLPRESQFLAFESGDLDLVEHLSAPDLLFVTGSEAWRPYVHRMALLASFGSRFDVRIKPFDDVRVRQAMNYALDRASITKLLAGVAVPAHGILAPGMLGFDPAIAPYPHDPAKARALLAAAGYPDGFSTAYLTTTDIEAATLAASLQADLAEVGIRVEIQQMSYAALGTELGKNGGAPFAFASWVADYPDPSNFFDARFHSRSIADESSQNLSWYRNPRLDALLDEARADPDSAKRAAMYRTAERIVFDDAPWLWGYHRETVEVTQPYVMGYAPHPVWIRDFTTAWLGERVPR